MQVTETKKQLSLREPEAALAWIDAFKARCRAEKKADVPAAGTTPARSSRLLHRQKWKQWLSRKLKRYWKIAYIREKDLLLPNKQNSWLLPTGMENHWEIFWHV